MSLCEVCKIKKPASLIFDHTGTRHAVCDKCRPQITVHAILAEMAIQKSFLEEKLFKYIQYLKENPHSQNTYQISQSFNEDFETMMSRLSQIILVKHFGRVAKSDQGWIQPDVPLPVIKPKTKPKKTKKPLVSDDLKPKKTKPSTKLPKKDKELLHADRETKPKAKKTPKSNKYNLTDSTKKTWQRANKKT